MSTQLSVMDSQEIERVLLTGDLSRLTPDQKLSYYNRVCESLDLNPLTKPFQYLKLNGKEILYASKDCTEQLRKKHTVSVRIVAREVVEGCYVVTAQAALPSGRVDESIGAVPIENLRGEARSNAMMKCETKAKRRVTLSICGLGMLDESEVDSIPGAMFPDQGSKEAQQDVAQRKIKELSAPKVDAVIEGQPVTIKDGKYVAVPASTYVELANSLDQPQEPPLMAPDVKKPPKSSAYEMREAAKQQEAAEALKGDGAPKETRKRGAISFTALKWWGAMKSEIKDLTGTTELYYKRLDEYGFKHADEIATKEQALAIGNNLKADVAELKRSKDDKALLLEAQTHALRIGPTFTKQILEKKGLLSVEDILNLSGDDLTDLLQELKTTA